VGDTVSWNDTGLPAQLPHSVGDIILRRRQRADVAGILL
jgi:hypothetical protein